MHNEERKCVVTVKRGVDKWRVMQELAELSGSRYVPERPVQIVNERSESTRNFNAVLTQREVATLLGDPRIEGVRWGTKDEASDVSRGGWFFSTGSYYHAPDGSDPFIANLAHGAIDSRSKALPATGLIDTVLRHNAGDGVDIVIFDSGIDDTHPEFLDEDGNSRLVRIDWPSAADMVGQVPAQHPDFYNLADSSNGIDFVADVVGHGTHMAGCAVGNTYGQARRANLYLMKAMGSFINSTWTRTQCFQLIRNWHLRKGNNRPTILNMSFGTVTDFTNIIGGRYRGVDWEGSGFQPQYGITNPPVTGSPPLTRAPDEDAELEECLEAGILGIRSAGNYPVRIDSPGGLDYDNYFLKSSAPLIPIYYHRGAVVQHPGLFHVGLLSVSGNRHGMSAAGPGVNIYSPGENIPGARRAAPTPGFYFPYRDAASPFWHFFGTGTSPSSPNLGGIIACFWARYPHLTNRQIVKLVTEGPLGVRGQMNDSGLPDDYTNDTGSLLGGANVRAYDSYKRRTERKPFAPSNVDTFVKTGAIGASQYGWNKLAIRSKTDPFPNGRTKETGIIRPALTGKGVDVVVIDFTGVDDRHQDFFDDAGQTRVVRYDWSALADEVGIPRINDGAYLGNQNDPGHGHNVASLIVGRRAGFAKDAALYNIVTEVATGLFTVPNAYRLVLEWHQRKRAAGNMRPTLIHMSFVAPPSPAEDASPSNIIGGVYRGEAWDRDGRTLAQLRTAYGIHPSGFLQSSDANAVMEQCHAAGIITTQITPWNGPIYIAEYGDQDWDNHFFVSGTPEVPRYYMRGPSPWARYNIYVSGVDKLERKWELAPAGPGVTVYAPAVDVYVAGNQPANYGTQVGTSFAGPQVAATVACLLEARPHYTQEQVYKWLIKHAVTEGRINDVGSGYDAVNSLMGGYNRYAYFPFSAVTKGGLTG
jgi:subtilisin family serine protease